MNKVFDLKRILALLVIIFYSSLSIFGIIHMSHESHMGAPMHDCPYMIGEQGLCSMSLSDHILEWQTFSKAFFPMLPLLLLSLVAFVGLSVYVSSSPPPLYFKLQRYRYTEPLYQSLFSNGILHSKAF